MKQSNTFIVLRNKKGEFLAEFKNNTHVLAYSAGFVDEIEAALIMPVWAYEKQAEELGHLCGMMECEPIKVQAEYTLTTLDGQEPAEAEKDERDEIKQAIKKMLFGD